MAKRHITMRLDERILEELDRKAKKELQARSKMIEKQLKKSLFL